MPQLAVTVCQSPQPRHQTRERELQISSSLVVFPAATTRHESQRKSSHCTCLTVRAYRIHERNEMVVILCP